MDWHPETLRHRLAEDEAFHLHFRELLLHAAAREGLFCPIYVLMPDHLHLLWMGLCVRSDQRNAMKFLRKHLAVELAGARPLAWNLNCKNSRTTVSCARKTGCAAHLKNPAFISSTIHDARNWWAIRATGRFWVRSCQAIPCLGPLAGDFWQQFWKIYIQNREPMPV